MSEKAGYTRGAFVAYDPGGYNSNDESKRHIIPFRFNPEVLSRSISIEQAEGGEGGEGGGGGEGEQGSDASSGTVKESFSVVIRLDYADREDAKATQNQSPEDKTAELGVLPEVCALEELLYPAEAESSDNSDGSEAVSPRPPRPTVLFLWGTERVFPIKITGMNINETLHNRHLNPIRAEIEVSLEVATEADARDSQAFEHALDFNKRQRKKMAKRFYETTSSQNTRIPDLTSGQ